MENQPDMFATDNDSNEDARLGNAEQSTARYLLGKKWSYFKGRLWREWAVLQSFWKLILFGVLTQYLHNIGGNVAYYLDDIYGVSEQHILVDMGFELMPKLSDAGEAASSSLFSILFAFNALFILSSLFLESQAHLSTVVLIRRLFLVAAVCQILRITTFLLTLLPSPAEHCRSTSPLYKPPRGIIDIFFRVDPSYGCGDLLFSSHTTFTTCNALMIHTYAKNKYLKCIAWSILIIVAFCITASQGHYTIDVFVALYVVPAYWFVLNSVFPDPTIAEIDNLQKNTAAEDSVAI